MICNTNKAKVSKMALMSAFSILLVLCCSVSVIAELNPVFDIKNQNGMPGYSFPVGDVLNFTYSPDGEQVMAYNWNITKNCPEGIQCSDGGQAICVGTSVRNFLFEANEPGNYTMNLTVVGGEYPWTSYSYSHDFSVVDFSEYIRAEFSYSVNYDTIPATVTLFDLSEAQKLALITNWYWSVNNTVIEDADSPVITRDDIKSGNIVGLTVRDKAGNVASTSKAIVIAELPGPVADFVVAPASGFAPLNVSFIDLSYSGSPIVGYNWTFGEGNTSTVKNPVFEYTTPGTYPVTLKITDKIGNNASSAGSVLVKASTPVDQPLVANFTAIKPTGDAPLNVQFIDLSSGNAVAWNWDFGDGKSSSEKSPLHTFMRTGTFTVQLDVYNEQGEKASTSRPGFVKINKYSVINQTKLL